MGIDSHVNTSDVWSIGGLLKKQDKIYSTADLAGTWAIAGFGDDQGTSFHSEFGSVTCERKRGQATFFAMPINDRSFSQEKLPVPFSFPRLIYFWTFF